MTAISPVSEGQFKHKAIRGMVERAVRSIKVIDIHTHLYDPGMKGLLLWGIDELLVYHYLVAEMFRYTDISYDEFWSFSKQQQAELIWKYLFEKHSPISEACRGVLTVLHRLGLDPRKDDLPKIRDWFNNWTLEAYVNHCMELAGVSYIYMTNSPFDPEELKYWQTGWIRDSRFIAALRIDPLLLDWPCAGKILHQWGYDVGEGLSPKTISEIQRALRFWIDKMEAYYIMVSLPPNFEFPAISDTNRILEEAVLPVCREYNLPLALMLGVRRAINPRLRLAGDGLGFSNLNSLVNLCSAYPENKFLVTVLSRENQHELCVIARKFRNLHPFGCWWFTNIPSMIEEITAMRLELLGWSFTVQHSDARILDQLIYKWDHTRDILIEVLTRKYLDMTKSGWEPTWRELLDDVFQVFGGAFEQFCGKKISKLSDIYPEQILYEKLIISEEG